MGVEQKRIPDDVVQEILVWIERFRVDRDKWVENSEYLRWASANSDYLLRREYEQHRNEVLAPRKA